MTDHKGTFDIDDNSMGEGDWLVSKNGDYKMGIQDGRLVVQDKNGNIVQQTEDVGAKELFFDEDDGWFDDDTNISLENDGDEKKHLLSHANDDGKGGSDDVSQIAITNDGRIIFIKGDSKLPGDWDGNHPGDKKVISGLKLDGLETVKSPENLRRDTFGFDYNPLSPDKLKDDSDTEKFPLKIQKPKATGGAEISPELDRYIDLSNYQLAYLTHQIGTGDINKPKFLQDPKGDDKTKDDSLDEKFVNELKEAAGKSYESESLLATRLALMKRQWAAVDKGFGTQVLKIDEFNHMTYKSMYERIYTLNDKIANSLVDLNDSEKKELKNADGKVVDPSAAGIQHAVEEQPLYGYIRDGVNDCIKYVNDYVEEMERMAKANPEFKEIVDDGKNHPGNDPKPKEEEKPKKDDDKNNNNNNNNNNNKNDNNGNNNTGNQNNGNSNDPQFGNQNNGNNNSNNNGNQDKTKPVNADTALSDLDKEFSNILGTTPGKTGDDTGTTDATDTKDTKDTGGDEKESLLQTAKDYLNGDGGSNGATTAQPAIAPTNNAGGMDPSMLMGLAGLTSAMGGGGLLGGDPAGKEDKDDNDDKDDKDQNREAPGPAQQSPGVTTAAAPADPGATAQPAVTAPTNAGSPPPVNTPGASVDHKLPGSTTPIKVPQGVADALTKVEGNPAIDASTAYADTSGAQTADKPWKAIDASQLRTGDVIVWENHSEIVIDNGSGPQYLDDNNQLVSIDPNNQDSAQYGKFQNYLHPTGLDAGSAAPLAPEPTELPDPKVTQSAPPQPPAVEAPKEPQAT